MQISSEFGGDMSTWGSSVTVAIFTFLHNSEKPVNEVSEKLKNWSYFCLFSGFKQNFFQKDDKPDVTESLNTHAHTHAR